MGNAVVGLHGAFFDEFFADAVGDVGFRDGGGAFAEFGGELDGCGDGCFGFGVRFFGGLFGGWSGSGCGRRFGDVRVGWRGFG